LIFDFAWFFGFYQYTKFSSSESVLFYLKTIVNYVDGWYQEFGVRVVLVHAEFWNNKDQFEIVSDGNQVII